MPEHHRFTSVADMMRKHPSPAELLLIKPAATPPSVFGQRSGGNFRPN